ncbi:hypothetical protein BDP27DRAFT_1261639 [Rhodocollybia butyracea]|uniref:Uncharacterized protein n=1 Tax=Rhodocollybia butyracea TaxID=206335 RepID=A0A9P5Q0F5_9AGAR|nr:hypothetical protein BDP27DRAFT_1261639 [Rhodocollybia butyracea]
MSPKRTQKSRQKSRQKSSQIKGSPKKKPPVSPPPAILSLCIAQRNVAIYSHSVADIKSISDVHRAYTTVNPPPTIRGYLYILEDKLEEFERVTGAEMAGWLIDIAHGLCDPSERRGQLVVWDEDQYRPVGGQDPLEAKVYEYRIDVIVSLTKISLRNVKSVTRASGLAGTMANAVKTRDGRCWVTGSTIITVNSHVCPKRMGNEQGAFIYSRYTGSPAPPGLTIYDPCFGICLCKNFDTFFDIYGIGFRKILDGNGQIQYGVHNFSEHNLDRLGYAFANSTTQPVHGFIITPPDPTSPPPGLMYWHYLQCVIRRFGHRMFRESDNMSTLSNPCQWRATRKMEMKMKVVSGQRLC